MHKLGVAQDILERVEKRRGRRHIYDRLTPSKTALLVIDMQNTFMAEGAPAEVPVAREIVPNINRLAAATRRAGGTVIWIQMTMTPGDTGEWTRFFGEVNTPERSKRMFDGLSEGNDGWAFWPTLDIQKSDLIVRKNRYSAYLPGSSELPALLEARGIDTIVITGTLTNVCCESTARDAMMRNVKVAMVSDANAALSDRDHQAALTSIYFAFGDVLTTDEVLAALGPGAARSAAE
jgi:ureidoacrylate peracid hydrolase